MDITGYWIKDIFIEPVTAAVMYCRAGLLSAVYTIS
jgi:hypothetical protein